VPTKDAGGGPLERAERFADERKGYPAPPAKTSDLPKVPTGPATGNGGNGGGSGDKTT
jgi:hypothetical protein